jgi:hypothetical protein
MCLVDEPKSLCFGNLGELLLASTLNTLFPQHQVYIHHHKMEDIMSRSPVFPILTEDNIPADFFRNYLCLHYDICLEEAADQNRLLDCSICTYKDNRTLNFTFKTNLP